MQIAILLWDDFGCTPLGSFLYLARYMFEWLRGWRVQGVLVLNEDLLPHLKGVLQNCVSLHVVLQY